MKMRNPMNAGLLVALFLISSPTWATTWQVCVPDGANESPIYFDTDTVTQNGSSLVFWTKSGSDIVLTDVVQREFDASKNMTRELKTLVYTPGGKRYKSQLTPGEWHDYNASQRLGQCADQAMSHARSGEPATDSMPAP
jgi:hypothetical protein